MDNRAGEMQVFLQVVDSGSFSEAARTLRMTPSTVSKLVARVEERLGVRLLERSTRRLALTEEGRIYYERSRDVLDEMAAVERDLSQGSSCLGGRVRVSSSVGFGMLGVEPLLPEFRRLHPRITVDLSLSDEIVDLYLDRTDVAFRVGPLPDSSMTAIRLGTAKRMIVASPDYLEQHGTPASVHDLEDHECLGFNFRRTNAVWPLKDSGRIVDRMVEGPLIANNGETVRRAAVAGMGLARIGEFHVREDLKAGRLVEVLAGATEGDTEEVHAVFLGGERVPNRVRAFLDFTTARLRGYLSGAEAA
ncbi:LysR family transcriptional regulator [Mameliella sediminis]|uniref:LysR family transcriptional regulator n=1 Tax=Mameliella sediminis TaxID=2836866 RepID=UPI001C4544CE|nr:LysR family transcriptional regulator [Mameliella sediminis]MBY6114277.1 LysR family transcriptional regulator [Antarctobacter heliothermus]MBY6143850.1 LysR family transcriptional regulator [Mameliella alba]MBV7393242.1 LysR family transcriptional regulator [Mameliella sediminis]MBY6163286.1 LysR family transcriptional regulator [Mameliella alba]MBY6171549.1 LysR family transcriptional regulator [Mameliella alba]